MDRGEKEREREAGRRVTVCDVLVTAVTHCNGVGLYFTGLISHGTNIRTSIALSGVHTRSHTHIWTLRACVTGRVQPQASTPLVTNYLL